MTANPGPDMVELDRGEVGQRSRLARVEGSSEVMAGDLTWWGSPASHSRTCRIGEADWGCLEHVTAPTFIGAEEHFWFSMLERNVSCILPEIRIPSVEINTR